jgi:histidine triad (HIT) family protein
MDCIFCKIVKGEIPSFKIWENDNFLAILDINPSAKGMTLVLPKSHYESDILNVPEDVYQKLMLAGKKVAEILKRKLEAKRIVLIMEGLGVNHAHIKLYPVYDAHEGGISTTLGPQADFEELKQLAEKLKNNN